MSQTKLGAMLDHVDFASGAAIVIDGALTKQPGIQGIAASVEADEGLHAQVYVQFESEDRASNLHATYRPVLE